MFSASKNVIIAAVAAVVSIFAIIMLAWRAGTATPPAPPQRPEAAKTEQQSLPSQQQAAAMPDVPATVPTTGEPAAGGNSGGGTTSPAAPAGGAVSPSLTASGNPAAPASPATLVPSAGAALAPSFDIVRVEPSGETVVAGRAAPGSVVTLTSSGKPAGTATADSNGQFVIIPEPLKPGAQELALTVRGPAGEQQSLQSVAVSVPTKGSKEEVIVALAEPGKPTQILSDPKPTPQVAGVAPSAPATAAPDSAKPAASQPAATADKPAAGVSFRTVEVEQGTGFLASGSAAAGAQLRLYLNDAHVADVTAASNGQWSLRVARGLPAGKYAVRADQIDPSNGKVLSRAEVPFVVTPQVAATEAPRAGGSTSDAAPDAGARAGESAALARTPQNIPGAAPQGGIAAASSAPVAAANPPQAATQRAATLGGTPAAPVQRQASAEPQLRTGNPEGASERPATSSPSLGASAASSSAGNSPAASPTPATSPSAAATGAKPAATVAAAPSSDPANVTIDQLITATVVRGDSLWRISRKMLGRGVRYTQIYDANTSQIRDPHRIYPGQVLVVPKDREPGAKSP